MEYDVQNKMSQIIINTPDSFTLIFKDIPYNFSIKPNENFLSMQFKRQMSPNSFKAMFSYEDFKAISRYFFIFEDLKKIHQFIIFKIKQEKFSLVEENDYLYLYINTKFEDLSEEIKFKIPKNNEEIDLNSHFDDMCKTIVNLSNRLKKIESLNLNDSFDKIIVDLKERLKNVESFNSNNDISKELAHLSDRFKKIETILSENFNEDKSLRFSKILKLEEIPYIINWIGCEYKFELLYRASKHGKSSNYFHKKCDEEGKTITFIESTDGNRFGGYSEQPWDKSGSYKIDEKAFLFSLNKNKKLTINAGGQNSIYCHQSYGPTFGGNHDLYVSTNFDGNSYSNLLNVYGKKEGVEKYFLTGNYNFTPKEIEVYLVY